jgi:hypothetical protein
MTKPTLNSNDFDKDQKSFMLDTDDSYFIRETVAYVKGTPATHANAVTVIVYFHGFYVNNRNILFKDLDEDHEVKLLENLKNCPIKELIFIAPWMGWVKPPVPVLDKEGKKIPLLDKKGEIIPGAFKTRYPGSSQYSDVEANLGKAADDYLAKVLEGLANFLDSKGQALKGSDGKPASVFTIKNLIVASHSGGGAAMAAFVSGLGSSNTAALKGCWCFDCLYGKDSADFWFKRAVKDKNAAPFYAYYQDTATNAERLLELRGQPGQPGFSQQGSNLNVIDYSKKEHYLTVSEGFAERLKDVKLP